MNEKDFSNDKDENLSNSEKDKKQSAKRPKKRKVSVDEYRYMEKINLPQTGNIEDFIDLELISRHRNKIRSSFEKLAISSPDIKLNISNRSKKQTFSRIETWKKVVSDAVEEY